MSKSVPFQTIQFSINTQFKCKYSLIVKKLLFKAIQFSQTVLIQTIQFNISMQLVLFDPYTGPYQVLLFWVDLGAMAIKGWSAFLKVPHHGNLTIRLFIVISGHSLGESYFSVEKQSVYSTAPADWANYKYKYCIYSLNA